MPECLAQYFSNNEMLQAIEQSKRPIEVENKSEQEIAESDSEPSCDNFDAMEMKDAF